MPMMFFRVLKKSSECTLLTHIDVMVKPELTLTLSYIMEPQSKKTVK